MAKRKPYFAQNSICNAFDHRAKYFYDLDEARCWLKENGGGSIKKRNAGIVRDPFIREIRVWGVIEEVYSL